jgi:pSer/pThr/pTyr-binding forkhead associated (FHA) protein
VLDDPRVSRYHARILIEPAGAFLEDLGSTNGTFLGSVEGRITRAPLLEHDTVSLGGLAIPAREHMAGPNDIGNASSIPSADELVYVDGNLVLGRDPGCDPVFAMPTVSSRHARLSRSSGSIWLEDLGSSNGT